MPARTAKRQIFPVEGRGGVDAFAADHFSPVPQFSNDPRLPRATSCTLVRMGVRMGVRVGL
jgi:hypothetical protein